MAKFNYDDIVRIKVGAMTSANANRRDRAWVVAVIEDRERFPLSQFPPGVVYSIEFEDGTAVDIQENDLELAAD
jgi:hypothetical protein